VENEILNCPCCGSEPIFTSGETFSKIECPLCGLKMEYDGSETCLKVKWNSRAIEPREDKEKYFGGFHICGKCSKPVKNGAKCKCLGPREDKIDKLIEAVTISNIQRKLNLRYTKAYEIREYILAKAHEINGGK